MAFPTKVIFLGLPDYNSVDPALLTIITTPFKTRIRNESNNFGGCRTFSVISLWGGGRAKVIDKVAKQSMSRNCRRGKARNIWGGTEVFRKKFAPFCNALKYIFCSLKFFWSYNLSVQLHHIFFPFFFKMLSLGSEVKNWVNGIYNCLKLLWKVNPTNILE